MNDLEFKNSPLSALEVSGAISTRIIHDLSNLVGGIVGNAEYAATSANDPDAVQKAIQAIIQSANSVGKMVGQCLPLQRYISGDAFPYDTIELAHIIAESRMFAPDWRITVPPALKGQVAIHPRWFTAAVWQIIRETQSSQGEIEFTSGPMVFPVVWRGPQSNQGRPVELFQILLRYRSDAPLLPGENMVTPERPGLFAACELIRVFKGQIQCRPKPPGRQEISVLLPLH
jgi:hypothetical protein